MRLWQKTSESGESVFFISPQTRTASSEIGFAYDELVSGNVQYLFNEAVHRYRVGPTTLCTAGQQGCTLDNALSVVDRYSTAGLEAGSNGPVEGPNMLMGDNPIRHTVDRVNFTITNTALPGHVLYPGTVVHSLSMDAATQWSWSKFSFQSVNVINLTTTGTGTGAYGRLNNMLGPFLFNSTHINSLIELRRQAR